MIHYTLTRSNRKTLALSVRDGAVEIRAPLKMPKNEIDRIVASKEAWIMDRLKHTSEQAALRSRFTLGYGDAVPVRGREYPIAARDGNRIGFDGECFYLPPGLQPAEIKRVVIQIYRIIAKSVLTQRVVTYANRIGLQPIAVKINGAKTRWGSCSGKNSLNFAWRLLMAEDDVIDYVVVHELMHIREHNHSGRFWAQVESVMPDYKEKQEKLRALQRRLEGEEWD